MVAGPVAAPDNAGGMIPKPLKARQIPDWQRALQDSFTRPQDLLDGNAEGAINYYAQVWALVHFLHEGENALYRADLDRCLRDTSNGTLTRTVHARLGQRAANAHRTLRIGPQVFITYFGDVETASRQYDAFVEDIVRTGARDRVAAGLSPVTR